MPFVFLQVLEKCGSDFSSLFYGIIPKLIIERKRPVVGDSSCPFLIWSSFMRMKVASWSVLE